MQDAIGDDEWVYGKVKRNGEATQVLTAYFCQPLHPTTFSRSLLQLFHYRIESFSSWLLLKVILFCAWRTLSLVGASL